MKTNYTFWQIGIHKQETATTLAEATRELNNSCEICWFRNQCEMKTNKYGQSQLDNCGIYSAHEKVVKRIVQEETEKFVNINININLGGK